MFDPEGRLLLVRDRLRREWGYPGGYLELGDTPLAACMREVHEEVGLSLAQEQLLEVGRHEWDRPRGLLEFTTYAARITAEQATSIRLQRFELLDSRWVTRAEAVVLIAPRLRERLGELLVTYDRLRDSGGM